MTISPRTRAWMFSSATPRSVPAKASGERCAARPRRRSRSGSRGSARRATRRRRARPARLRQTRARRHGDADDVLRPQRLDGERRGQRRVDPARDPEDDVREAVLLRVVAQAELDGEAHLLELVEQLARRPCRRRPLRGGSPRGTSTIRPVGQSRQRPREGTAARVAEAAGHRGRSRRRRPAAAPPRRQGRARRPRRSRRARGSGRRRSARPGRRRRSRSTIQQELSRARVASISSRSAPLPTWKGEAEMFATTCAPASARSVAGGPGCQMSSQTVGPTSVSPAAQQHETAAGLEVPVLVEDAVVGQELLAVDRLQLAVDAARRRR